MSELVKVAVVTGGHPYDVQGLHRMFRSFENVDTYVQHMDNYVSTEKSIGISKDGAFDPDAARASYDVVMFFHMLRDTPEDEGKRWWEGAPKAAMDALIKSGKGVFVWHHGLLAHPKWDEWNDITGIRSGLRSIAMDRTLRVEIADQDHPITDGLEPFEVVDETYDMDNPDADSHILLTVDDETSMSTVAWTREHKKSRVFCLQLGHDDLVWSDANFKTVVERGLFWCARKA